MIRNRKYLGRRVLAVLLAASVVCSSVLPAAAEELVSLDVAEESGMLIDAAEDDTSSGADDAIMDEDVPENGIADTEETESGWERSRRSDPADGRGRGPGAGRGGADGSRFPYDHEGRGAPDEH